MRHAALILAIMAAVSPLSRTHAQSTSQVVHYQAGWNMVGAPPGTSLGAAESLDLFTPAGYRPPASSTAGLCSGMWAYFAKLTGVPFTSMPPLAASISCPLQTGWNLIANPFIAGALLPAGTTGYFWNPPTGGYVPVTEIPLGAAVWIYSSSEGSVSITAAPDAAPAVSIPPQPSTQRRQLHVGERIELTASGQFPVLVSADPRYLILESSGFDGASTIWRFRAIAAGSTEIIVSPACAQFGCLAPDWLIGIDILPAGASAALTITPPIATAPYQAHVGDTIELKLLLLGPGTFSAATDARYLQLQTDTAQGAEPVRYDWRWLAIAPGITTIVIDRHGPDMPAQYVIALNISP